MVSNIITIAYLERARTYLEAYIEYLQQAQSSSFKLPYLIATSIAHAQYRFQLLALQNQEIVSVPCGQSFVNARSHPTFTYGRLLASFPEGSVFTNYEERWDSPPGTTVPKRWVRVTEYGGYDDGYTLWIRREDGAGNVLLWMDNLKATANLSQTLLQRL